MLINRLAGMVLPISSKYIIDDIVVKRRSDLLTPIAIAAGAATLLQALTSFALLQLLGVAAHRAVVEMRKKVHEHIVRLPIRYFDSTQTGKLIARIIKDADGVRNLISAGVVNLRGSLVTAVGSIAVLFYLNWRLTILTIIILLAFGGVLTYAMSRLRPLFRERSHNSSSVASSDWATRSVKIIK